MTSRIFKILANLSLKEAIVLVYGLGLDWFYKKLPANTFHVKNTYDKIIQSGGTFQKLGSDTKVKLNSSSYILRRKGSDFAVFDQIVLRNELLPVISELPSSDKRPLRIVDCGANIGMSVVYFKEKLPNSQIIAVEPNEENFAQLCKNIKINSFEGVHPLNMGVWYEPDMLSANTNFRDGSDWAFSLSKTNSDSGGGYRVDSIKNIAESNQWDSVDLLKIDIEGAEFDLFRNLAGWQTVLDKVKVISIEVHEEKGTHEEIERILSANNFDIKRAGELTIGVRRQPVASRQ